MNRIAEACKREDLTLAPAGIVERMGLALVAIDERERRVERARLFIVCKHCRKPEMNCDCDGPFEAAPGAR